MGTRGSVLRLEQVAGPCRRSFFFKDEHAHDVPNQQRPMPCLNVDFTESRLLLTASNGLDTMQIDCAPIRSESALQR